MFAGLKRVVVDEIHALAESKRGDQLMLALARLQTLCPGLRRVGPASLRHVRRTLGISLAWLHKKWCNREESNMKHRKGTDLSADSQTKALSKGPLQTMKELLGLKS